MHWRGEGRECCGLALGVGVVFSAPLRTRRARSLAARAAATPPTARAQLHAYDSHLNVVLSDVPSIAAERLLGLMPHIVLYRANHDEKDVDQATKGECYLSPFSCNCTKIFKYIQTNLAYCKIMTFCSCFL